MDWIDGYVELTSSTPSPPIFRTWAAITAVGGALDRRVWADVGLGAIYPNLYTLLVGPPGSGKSQAIAPAKKFWLDTKELHTAPDNVTKAALVDSLQRNSRTLISPEFAVPDGMMEVHSLLVSAAEFGVLISQHDLNFLSVLNHIFDSPPNYREERRSIEVHVDIPNPQITILAGTQPDFLASVMPEAAWGMGFCSRLMLIYAASPPEFELFNGVDISAQSEIIVQDLGAQMSAMARLYGKMLWTETARKELISWHLQKMPPIPDIPKLQHYITRRLLQVVKMITISAVSRSGQLIIEHEDVERAKTWMIEAERDMPEIFRYVLGRSDAEIIKELHQFVWKLWIVRVPAEREPIKDVVIYEWLKDKVPSEKVDKILDICEKAGVLVRSAGQNAWIPKALV